MKQCVSLFIHAAALRRAALVLIILAACQPSPPPLTLTSLPTTPGFLETATPSPVPTTIFTATASPTPTVEELVFPFTIDGLRQHDFQSGKIHIRSTLAENDRFTSYLIDYPSDGLTITGVMQIPIGEALFL
jgi:hypothetical protein